MRDKTRRGYKELFNHNDAENQGLTEQALKKAEKTQFGYNPRFRETLIEEGVISYMDGKYYYQGDSKINNESHPADVVTTEPVASLGTVSHVTPLPTAITLFPLPTAITLFEFAKKFLVDKMLADTALLARLGLPSSGPAIEDWLDANYLTDNNLNYARGIDPLANQDNEVFRELCSSICTQQTMPNLCDAATYFAIKDAFHDFDISYVADPANHGTIRTALTPIVQATRLEKFLGAAFQNAAVLSGIIGTTPLMVFFANFGATTEMPFIKYQGTQRGSTYKLNLVGIPIACQFLKEIGLTTLAKPDRLLKAFADNLSYTHVNVYPFGNREDWNVFDLVDRNAIGCTAYALDKIIWMCMSTYSKFYKHHDENLNHPARIKKEFLQEAKRLYGAGMLSIR